MKPFHSELGAVSWIEQHARGMVSVLVVAPARKAGKTILYTFKCSYSQHARGMVSVLVGKTILYTFKCSYSQHTGHWALPEAK